MKYSMGQYVINVYSPRSDLSSWNVKVGVIEKVTI